MAITDSGWVFNARPDKVSIFEIDSRSAFECILANSKMQWHHMSKSEAIASASREMNNPQKVINAHKSAFIDYNAVWGAICQCLDVPEEDKRTLAEAFFLAKRGHADNIVVMRIFSNRVSSFYNGNKNFAITLGASALVAVHDSWVGYNPAKLFDPDRKDRRYMFMPLQLFGTNRINGHDLFEKGMLDYIYVEPILEYILSDYMPWTITASDYRAWYRASVEVLKTDSATYEAVRDKFYNYCLEQFVKVYMQLGKKDDLYKYTDMLKSSYVKLFDSIIPEMYHKADLKDKKLQSLCLS